MSDGPELSDTTRRAVLKGVAGTFGISAVGSASAHEWGDDESDEGPGGENDPDHPDEGTRGGLDSVGFYGYHGLGSTGEATKDGAATAADVDGADHDYQAKYWAEAKNNPHYGGATEIRVHGDYAYITFFSSDDPTPGRAMAIVDISEYNDAETEEDLGNAELQVTGYLRNNNAPTAAMDVKISDDGQYAFISTQPYTALFGSIAGNTDDPTRAEIMDPRPNYEDTGFTPTSGGVMAVDVSDKENPRTVGFFELGGSGSHNAFHHRIDGDDYVFVINDSGNLAGVAEGMFVLRFDRGTGELELVNRWHFEDNNAQGEVSPGEYNYIHDVEVQNDPRTGSPVAYLSYWPRGMWALDVSDPENIRALGHFDMDACHFTSPAPDLVEMPDGRKKRVAVASQEISESSTHTGRIYLVDCDGLFPDDPRYYEVPRTVDGVALLGELDMWEWHAEYETPGEDAIDFGPYDFSLSPHNSDFAQDADGNFWVHQSHYTGGIRFLRVDPPSADARREEELHGLVSDSERFKCLPGRNDHGDCKDHEFTGRAGPHYSTDWNLVEEGWARPDLKVPHDSRMEGLNYMTPFCWGANVSNGVTFAGDINQGVYALKHDDIPVGRAPPEVDVTRADDAIVFTAGQTNRVELTLSGDSEEVLVRDQIPDGWDVVGGGGDVSDDGSQIVFDLSGEETGAYYVEAPQETGGYTFGPIAVSNDGGTTWHTIPGTTDTNVVAGGDQNDATLGTIGTVGILAHQRDRIKQKTSDLFGTDDD
jgi:hypothetical protein